jgi:serine/threonine-protein kinase
MPLPPDLSIVTTAATGDLAISPNGQVIVFTATAPDGARRLYARALDDLAPRALAGTEGAAAPFFSPDGRWIGFLSRRQLRKVPAEGGLPQALAAMDAWQGATWTNRDVIVFAAPGGLFVIPSTGGTATLLSAPDSSAGEIGQMYPLALPDGDHVLYSSLGRNGPSIGIASISARSAKPLGIVGTNALGVVDGLVIYATRDNVLMAVALDAPTGRTYGATVPIATQVAVGVVGSAKAALSLSGSLAYRAADRGSRMVATDGKRAAEMVLPESRA